MINPLAFTNLLPAITGSIKYRKLPVYLKAVTWMMAASVLLETYNTFVLSLQVNNMYSAHLYNLISFVCLSIVYKEQLPPVMGEKKIVLIGIAGCVLCILNTVFLQPLTVSPTYARTITEIIILMYAVGYIYKLIVTDNKESLWNMPMFWINTGILLLFGLVFFINLNYNFITNMSKPVRAYVNQFRQTFLLLHYLSLGVALWIYRQK